MGWTAARIIQLVYVLITMGLVGWVLYDPSIPIKEGLQALGVLVTPAVMIINNLRDKQE